MIRAADEIGIDSTPLFESDGKGGFVRAQRVKPHWTHAASKKVVDTTVTPVDILTLSIPWQLPFRFFFLTVDPSNFTAYNFYYDLVFMMKGEEMLRIAMEKHNAATGLPATVDAAGNPTQWAVNIDGQNMATQAPFIRIGRVRADATGTEVGVGGFPINVTADKAIITLRSIRGSTYGASPDATFFLGVLSSLYQV